MGVFLIMKGRTMTTITKNQVKRMKLKGKPRCPKCRNPLTFVYEGATGVIGVKCLRCNCETLVNNETLEVTLIK